MADWKSLIKAAPKGNGGAAKTPAQKIAASMDKALAAYKKGNVDVKRPTIKAVGDQVEFSVRFANQALELAPGISIAQVAAVQFETVWTGIRASVIAGEFDAQVKPLADKALARGAKMVAAKKAPAKKPAAKTA